MTSILAVSLAGAGGYGLYRVMTVDGEATTVRDFGRKWLAWMVFIGTLSTLPRFLRQFDADSFATWLVTIVFFGALAFVGGCLYGTLILRGRTLAHRSLEGSATDNVTAEVDPSKQIGLVGRFRIATGALRSADDDLYAQSLHEIDSDNRRDGVWAKALSKSGGDERRARALYISLVVKMLRVDAIVGGRVRVSDLRDSENTHSAKSIRENQSLPAMPDSSGWIALESDSWQSRKKNANSNQDESFEEPLSDQSDRSQEKEILVWAIGLCLVYVALFAVMGADWSDFAAGLLATPMDSKTATIFGHVFVANLLTGAVWFGLKFAPSVASKWSFRSDFPSGSIALNTLLVISGAQWALSLIFLGARIFD